MILMSCVVILISRMITGSGPYYITSNPVPRQSTGASAPTLETGMNLLIPWPELALTFVTILGES